MLGIVRHQFDELADTFREMVQVPMNGNRLEKYLEYVFPEPKDRLPTESEADCIQRDRSWSEYFFDQGAGNRLQGSRRHPVGSVQRRHRDARPPQNPANG